jgi:hypothetical protein
MIRSLIARLVGFRTLRAGGDLLADPALADLSARQLADLPLPWREGGSGEYPGAGPRP